MSEPRHGAPRARRTAVLAGSPSVQIRVVSRLGRKESKHGRTGSREPPPLPRRRGGRGHRGRARPGRAGRGADAATHAKPLPADIFIDHGLNKETRLETLRGYLTPASHFFVRNHAPTPVVDLRTWRLRVEGNARRAAAGISFDELLRLPSRSVICYVECAGNGRGFFKEFMGKVASGTQWRLGAIGVAEWTGVPLGAILELARVKRDTPRDPLNVLVEEPRRRQGQPADVAREGARGRHADRLRHERRAHPGGPRRARARHRARLGRHQQHQVGGAHRGAGARSTCPRPRAPTSWRGPTTPARRRSGSRRIKSAVALPWGGTLPAGRQRLRGFAWSPVGRIAASRSSLDRGATWTPTALREPNIPRAWVTVGPRVGRAAGRPHHHDARHRRPGQHAAGEHAVERAGLRLQRAGAAPGAGGLTGRPGRLVIRSGRVANRSIPPDDGPAGPWSRPWR